MIVLPNGPSEYIEIDTASTTRSYEIATPHDRLHSSTNAAVIYTDGREEEYWWHGVQYNVDYWIDYAFNGIEAPCT